MVFSRVLDTTISIPRKLYEEACKKGIDVESFIVDLLADKLGMDPVEEAEIHLELAEKFLTEGVELVDKDPIQASEKLYKAAEECIKAIAKYLKLEDILSKVRSRGRWTITDLEKTARIAAERIGEDIYVGWDRANYLHIWGFHEAKIDVQSVKARIPYIEKMVKKLREELKKKQIQT